MTIPAATILDSVAVTLLDTAGRTWSPDELLGYLNEALRTTALAKPDVYTVENSLILAAGVQQLVPADGVALIDIPRNTNGRVVTQVDKTLLDEASRFWPAGTQESTVEHFTADPRDPLRFVVFPPNDGEGVVDIVYAAIPPQVMYAAETLPVNESYQAPLQEYMLGRAYAKNSKRQDLQKSVAYFNQWGAMLGLDAKSQLAILPKVDSAPGTT